jgi:hypothetical protein
LVQGSRFTFYREVINSMESVTPSVSVTPAPASVAVPGQSGLGIASLILSIVSGLGLFLLLAVAGIVETSTPGGMDENSPEAVLIGLFLIGFVFSSLLALGLGIGGLVQQNRRKAMAVVGTVLASVSLIGITFIMMLGIALG